MENEMVDGHAKEAAAQIERSTALTTGTFASLPPQNAAFVQRRKSHERGRGRRRAGRLQNGYCLPQNGRFLSSGKAKEKRQP